MTDQEIAEKMMGQSWSDRLGETVWIDPEQLLANPRNYRIHPQEQQDAVSASLDEIGWIKPIIAVDGSDLVLDGHLRVALALRASEPLVPVQYVTLTPDEEAKALLVLDTTVEMAVVDKALMAALINDVQPKSEAMFDFVAGLMEKYGLEETSGGATPPSEFPAFDDTIDTKHQCPSCGYQWSGKAS